MGSKCSPFNKDLSQSNGTSTVYIFDEDLWSRRTCVYDDGKVGADGAVLVEGLHAVLALVICKTYHPIRDSKQKK